jgi:hypothetical protein
MLADLDETIKDLLVAEMPIKNGEIDVNFDQPKREWSARLTKPTVNFFLYDMRQNVQLRQFQWERVPNRNGRPNHAALKRPPIRLDCHYMITAWANEAEDEHRLLTRTLLALFRFPKLPPDQLKGRLGDQEFDVTAQLASHDKLTNAAEIWSALDNELRPSISYLVTVTLDPWTPIEEPIVRGLGVRVDRTEFDPDHPAPATPESVADPGAPMTTIAGTVRRDGAVVADVRVALAGAGLSAVTGNDGRFRIRGVSPGVYTLQATPPDGDGVAIERTVPIEDDDYDIDLS